MSIGTKTAPAGDRRPLDSWSLLDEKILAMIASHASLEGTLEALCDEIEKRQQGLICSVLLIDEDGVTLRSAAAPSLPKEYTQAVDGARAGPRNGSCGTAVYRKAPVVVSDIATDPLWADYKSIALPHGLRACWSAPISSRDGAILGTFAIYYREVRTPDAFHVDLITHATYLAALAIERIRERSELLAAKDRYRALVEQLPAITYIAELGAEGPWQYVSPQIQSTLGFSPQEWLLKPQNWISRVHHEDREMVLVAERHFQETKQLFQAEYRMIARDGRVLWFRDEGVLLPGDHTPLLMQGVMHDITDRKHLEEQLRQSQKMQAMGQLAGGVAHDFNNLLMLINAHNERLRDRLTSQDPAYEDTSKIARAVTQAAALTRQLLAFSRRQLLQLRVVDLNSILAEAAMMLQRLMVHNIVLHVVPETAPKFVKADPAQLGQVILNLAVNARDAMPHGGTLTIATSTATLESPLPAHDGTVPPGKYVRLSVRDTGSGMTKEVMDHLFEPFFTTKEAGQGTGLGLAIVYGVIKQTGAWICVRSERWQGTTFDIYFAEAEEDAEGAILSEEIRLADAARGTETILLVEDQEGIREVVREALERRGYRVLCAHDGNRALEIASENTNVVDLLLSDIIMPNLSGPELAQRLADSRPMMKVVFMSGNPDDAFDRTDFEKTLVLQKPFPIDTLLRGVRSVLDE
jgi:PAS domain S-box-containing protein